MNVNLFPVKIKQRLNKLDSNDYDNMECWQYVEAFNKAQRDWCRRQLHGGNQFREGAEQTTRRIDDLQVLLKPVDLSISKKDTISFETEVLPLDYLQYNRLSVTVKEPCGKIRMTSDLIKDANLNEYLGDFSLKPSLEWRETFHTLTNNRFVIYTDGDFSISQVALSYYRQPREISLDSCPSIDGIISGDINPEFKDDIVELLIDETVSILAMDIESPNASTMASNRVTKNN